MAKPINIFIIYAREDKEEKRILLDFLSPMIEPYNLNIWHDDHIQPGQEWKPHIESRLNITDIFILLVSVNFLNSKFIKQVEFKYALDRHRENKSVVIPVIIKYCLWEEPLPYDNYSFSLAQLQVLPTEGKPIIEWRSADEAYSNIAKGIRSVIIERRANQKKQELQEEEFWNHAVQKNSVSSYNEYIQNYPEGKFYEEAKSAVIIFEEKEKERIERNKQEIEKAKTEFERQKIEEEILWKSTCDVNTLDAYNNYLEKSKLGSYREQANKCIAEIEKRNQEIIAEQERVLKEETENKLWSDASTESSISSYQKYLRETVAGLHKENAQQLINDLERELEQQSWQAAKTKNTINSYNEYLQHYPNGMFGIEAAAIIKEIKGAAPLPDKSETGILKPIIDSPILTSKVDRTIKPLNKKDEVKKAMEIKPNAKEKITVSNLNFLNRYKLYSIGLSIVIIISFFIPWFTWIGNHSSSAWDLAITPDYVYSQSPLRYIAFFIPICSMFLIFYQLRKVQEKLILKRLLFCTPFVFVVGFASFIRYNSSYNGIYDPDDYYVSFGLLLTFICSVCLFILAWVKDIDSKKTK